MSYYPNATIEKIMWDTQMGDHRIKFTDEDGKPHYVVCGFDPIIFHHETPKNRLHRWLIQVGTRVNMHLPRHAAENVKVEILDYAPGQYITGTYTNHEGKTEVRSFVPMRVRMEATEYHGLQYIIHGWCKDRKAERSFALADWSFRGHVQVALMGNANLDLGEPLNG